MANTGEDEDADGQEIGQEFPHANHRQNPEQEEDSKERIGGGREGIGGRIGRMIDTLIECKGDHVIRRRTAQGYGNCAIAG